MAACRIERGSMITTDAACDDAPDVWSHRSSRQRLVRVLPFILVALVGQLSALFNPTNMEWFWLSALAFVAAAAVLVAPPRRFSLCLTGACYIASVAALMMASGGVGGAKLILDLGRIQIHLLGGVEISAVANEAVFRCERRASSHLLCQSYASLHGSATKAGQGIHAGLDS